MNIQQILDLQREVQALLNAELPAQRRWFYEGAAHYLSILAQMVRDDEAPKRMRKAKASEKKDAGSVAP